MAKWKDLLEDKNTYPDDFVVSVKRGDSTETLSLGEMRSFDAESKGALTADLTRREQQLINATKNIGTLVEQVAERVGMTADELLSGKAPTRKQVAASTDLDESDPLVGTLVKEIKSLR